MRWRGSSAAAQKRLEPANRARVARTCTTAARLGRGAEVARADLAPCGVGVSAGWDWGRRGLYATGRGLRHERCAPCVTRARGPGAGRCGRAAASGARLTTGARPAARAPAARLPPLRRPGRACAPEAPLGWVTRRRPATRHASASGCRGGHPPPGRCARPWRSGEVGLEAARWQSHRWRRQPQDVVVLLAPPDQPVRRAAPRALRQRGRCLGRRRAWPPGAPCGRAEPWRRARHRSRRSRQPDGVPGRTPRPPRLPRTCPSTISGHFSAM